MPVSSSHEREPVDCFADTSAVIGLLRRDPRTIAAIGGRRFGISFVTVAELLLGVYKSGNRHAAMERLEEVLGSRRRQAFYPLDVTPILYAEICHDLEQRGARIPSNDIWIAAIAMENDLPLLGRDEHFSRVENLKFIPC